MQTTIYVDILISVNMIVNYFLLISTAKFLRFPVRRGRTIIGAVVGSLYSLFILVPNINVVLSFLIKLLMSASIVVISFGKTSKKNFLKSSLCFYLMNFSFAGIMFFLWYLIHPNGLVIHNSVVYFNISPVFLIITTITSYIVIELVNKVIAKHEINNLIYNIEVGIDGQKKILRAKVDTGNTLTEPFSNSPVAVVGYKYIKDILPSCTKKFFNSKSYLNNINTLPQDWKRRCRVIPFNVICSSGVLPSFKPDTITVISENNEISKTDVYIAVCNSDENITGNFEMLINPQIIEQ